MNKLYPLLLPLLLVANLAIAQPGRPPRNDGPRQERTERGTPEQREARFARIRAAREAFLTEQLELTEKEATAFFPVYWAYDEKMREAKRTAFRGQKDSAKNETITEAEARTLLMKDRTLRQEMLTLRSQTEDKLLKIIPASKIIRIPEVEKAFREKLWERTRGRRG